ncbi:oxaloacetate tautomerase fahd-1, mitochondrial-like [Babylonia areolata]|uniref:oxaloacetate tautomerase fahd-1, mitochondrial-like n=1 Tax=Babylonia areolata TaxID=304850 RepID=UPI003FCF9D80
MRIMSTAARFRELGKKIICVGRNYGAHAKELGNPIPEKPILFLKPTSSYVSEGSPIQIPKGCGSLHHEVELGVVIERSGKNISESSALDHIGGYILALDMTARDFQDEAKKKGQPWTVAKGFDTACPVSDFIPRDKVPDPQNIGLWCKVNGTTRQDGNTKDMMFSIPNLISYISQYFTLEPGDVILTGTPSGVGPTGAGDTIQCGLADIVSMQFTVASSQ